jgi:hypothetical protein
MSQPRCAKCGQPLPWHGVCGDCWPPNTPPTHDDIARKLVTDWIDRYAGILTTPGTRAVVLLTISRIATELAEREQAKLPDLFEG